MTKKNLGVTQGVTQNIRFSGRLARINEPEDIPARWHNTPIEALIGAHNFDLPINTTGAPQLLIATCIEFRFRPNVPRMYAYMIRRASGRIIGSEFSLIYTLSAGVRHVVLVGHDDCGMTKVSLHAPAMVAALVEQGWEEARAKEYISMHAGRYAIEDEVDSLQQEFLRLKKLFKKVEFAPLFASLSSNRLYIPNWYLEYLKNETVDDEMVNPQDILLLP